MTWYRIDDETRGWTVLIEADSSADATRKFYDNYAPNIYVTEAEQSDINDWQRDQAEWAKSGESEIWFQ